MNSNTEFYGFKIDGDLAGVIEIEHNQEFTDINSLVVHPNYFRQGIASHLIEFTLNTFDSSLFVVETGLENWPAIALYQKWGFKAVKQWTPDHGIRKVKLELNL